MNETLKPCPFCGNFTTIELVDQNDVAHLDEYNTEWSEEPYFQVMCSFYENLHATILGHNGCGSSSGFYPTREQAIAAWNHREGE